MVKGWAESSEAVTAWVVSSCRLSTSTVGMHRINCPQSPGIQFSLRGWQQPGSLWLGAVVLLAGHWEASDAKGGVFDGYRCTNPRSHLAGRCVKPLSGLLEDGIGTGDTLITIEYIIVLHLGGLQLFPSVTASILLAVSLLHTYTAPMFPPPPHGSTSKPT
jgi:hypothetical protein